ncbi:hypothetical protein Pmani_022970 [Petrolisthes manimaculis]|uniref:Uncharacterized protein n=1 Tax=Petrolisthes manimaculis TaxID=1843537 RepID=A0AAE1PAX7_9EUCA|nr:hypothetical protein Pmani_022970 [Petrolisthes manimaculis]
MLGDTAGSGITNFKQSLSSIPILPPPVLHPTSFPLLHYILPPPLLHPSSLPLLHSIPLIPTLDLGLAMATESDREAGETDRNAGQIGKLAGR